MTRAYLVRWSPPEDYDCGFLRALPSPIAPGLREIYNYAVRDNGLYFVDQGVDQQTAGEAFKMFLDEALTHADSVAVERL